MKYLKYLLLLVVVVSACKSQKELVTVAKVKNLSARKVVKGHYDSFFMANTLDAKLKVNYSNYNGKKRTRYGFSVRLRMKKDSLIWIKGTYKVLSAFRIKITPNSFSYYSPLEKHYFTGDFSLLKELLGQDVTFNQVQNLFLGQSMVNLKEQKFSSEVEEDAYKLTPKKQEDLYNLFFYFLPNNLRLKKQLISSDSDDKSLRVSYDSYINFEGELVPKKMMLYAKNKEKYTNIQIDFRSLTLNQEIKTPFTIPTGYKKIDL